jgi:hypothetical protein
MEKIMERPHGSQLSSQTRWKVQKQNGEKNKIK